jgi:hypothetical protein
MAEASGSIEVNDKLIGNKILLNAPSSCRRLLILNEKLLSVSPEDLAANAGAYEEVPRSQ